MAIINVSPSDNITALIASSAVSEGDVIRLAEGTYYQIVIVSKNYIRILPESCRAVFDGAGVLAAAFILNNVTGVEITGVSIKNYLADGIYIFQGSANRVACNKIQDISGEGIFCNASAANLIWKNCVRDTRDGILLRNGSTNNWVVENNVRNCSDDGIESFFAEDQNNAIIGNFACNCGDNCLEVFGRNCFVYRNKVLGANVGVLIASGSNNVTIENKSGNNTFGVFVNSQNAFLSRNEVIGNSSTGIQDNSAFGILQSNLVAKNKGSGVDLTSFSHDSLIYNNRVVCNTPSDIINNGTDNNLLNNRTGCEYECF